MSREEAWHSFWAGFGLKAYDENSVPDSAKLPYITYEINTGEFDETVAMSASIWYRSSSWEGAVGKQHEVEAAIPHGGRLIPYDNGGLWVKRDSPFAQRMDDASDDYIRRIVLAVLVEFIE